MEKIEKILLSVAAIVFSVSIIVLTLSDAKFIFGLARHGEETSATVIDTKSHDEGRGRVAYILKVEYTDKYNKTYIKNDIKTYKNLNPGDKITIIYNKFSPQVADIKLLQFIIIRNLNPIQIIGNLKKDISISFR